ncbi:MAG: hypothetical protein B7Z55_17145 [Planctomycetales bacterium 12-60-4]|nr:MAG: hypothetical protein B7Z55_17145 [Planctomycetales bacterium 12-60-4]
MSPDSSRTVADVNIYYSVDPDPRARFWRSAEVTSSGDNWTAPLPILSRDQPLFAFANVAYDLPLSASEPYGRPTSRFALSSLLHTVTPQDLQATGVRATEQPSMLIDDFSHGWRDWYVLSGDNRHHWEYSTRKLADPQWQGRAGQRLKITVQADQPNDLVLILTENFFRTYRGKMQESVAIVPLTGGAEPQTISLAAEDFEPAGTGDAPAWKNVDLLSLRPYYDRGPQLVGSKTWAGPHPKFLRLEWGEGER